MSFHYLKAGLYPVQVTNWWFLTWSPEIVSISDGSCWSESTSRLDFFYPQTYKKVIIHLGRYYVSHPALHLCFVEVSVFSPFLKNQHCASTRYFICNPAALWSRVRLSNRLSIRLVCHNCLDATKHECFNLCVRLSHLFIVSSWNWHALLANQK